MTSRRPLSVAFYAPMKPPDHPVPSGDRQMAGLLMAALRQAGHEVVLASTLRSHSPSPDPTRWAALRAEAARIADVIAAQWHRTGPPDLWFTYHNYYKAPDLLGPELTRAFSLPYAIAEASHASRRAADWGTWSSTADAATRAADMHISFTARDRAGLAGLVPPDRIVDLPPFIDAPAQPARAPRTERSGPPVILTVAMMRPGDKLHSYRFLAEALALLPDAEWRLRVVGDGPARGDVADAFERLPDRRVDYCGLLEADAVRDEIRRADLMVWPGFGEAYGLAYLEAQAHGLPVVALDTAGVPSVVRPGETGLLVATAEPPAFAAALRRLLTDAETRRRMGAAAARWVRRDRSLASASQTLEAALRHLVGRRDRTRVG